MTTRCSLAAATAALVLAVTTAAAQTNTPSVPLPASAPAATKAGPRLLTPAELRDAATTPGDLRPEERITPQIVVPLRKAAPPTKAERAAARRGRKAPPGTIDDAAARCEAEASTAARETCRAGIAHPAKTVPAR